MRLPDTIRESLDAALEARGSGRIRSVEPVGGGCITETGRLRTTDDLVYFMKWTVGGHPSGLFSAEADSLAAIAATRTVRVPDVIHVRDGAQTEPADGHDGRWLLLEWLEPGSVAAHTWTTLAEQLVALHRHRNDAAGWPTDNFIGTLPQRNAAGGNWPGFWRERRIAPQIRLARDQGKFDRDDAARVDALLAALDDLLAPAAHDGASLLHGDLWSGNLHILTSGDPALVDPSSAYGHREVDLAMSELFGGFDHLFYATYAEIWPLHPEYERVRRPIYQLYYLLVHVNLFGGPYRARALSALSGLGF